MKTFLKLAILVLLIYLIRYYLKDNNIDIKEKFTIGLNWIQENLELPELSDILNNETEQNENKESDLARKSDEFAFKGPSGSGLSYQESVPLENQISNETSINYGTHSSANVEEQVSEPMVPRYTSEENFAWIKEVSSEYAPEAWYLLMQYEQLPQVARVESANGAEISSRKPCGTFHYLEGDSRLELLQSMSTNVHELSHAFYRHNAYRYMNEKKLKGNFDHAEGYIYIDPQTGWLLNFPGSALFPSAKLKEVIPESLRTFRFDTYITGNTSTQSEGVFGLLNELHAYYQGSLYDYNVLDAYKEAVGSEGHGLGKWIQYSKSSMSACYEFDFFILEYLLFMKQQYSENYNKLRSYKPFREAYTEVRKRFYDLNEVFLARIEQEAKALTDKTDRVSIQDNYLKVAKSEGNRYNLYSFESEDRSTLLPVLHSARYAAIGLDWGLGE